MLLYDMKKRIGNDIQFTWHIYRKSGETQTPESFTGKAVEVKLISPLQRPVTIEDVTIATGVVTFTFRGKHQVTLGNYVAVLQENKGEDGMVTLDVVNAVTLVPHSYMEEDGDDGDVIEAESVELTSTISAGGGGGIVQQQADWAQTDASAVDFIKNKPNLDAFCRKDATNVHQGGYDQYIYNFGEESIGNVAIDAQGLWARLLYPNGELVSETRVAPGNIRITKNGVTLNLNPAFFQALVETIQAKANSADLATVATSGSYNDLSGKPDLSVFVTKTVDDLTNYYLKSETYTKNEVQQLIGAIQQFHYEVYPTLPQTGANNVLYLIGPTGTGADKYEEYVYSNNTWVKIGDTSIDLSGYVTTTALTTALADYVTSADFATALAAKQDKMPIVQVASGTTAINAAVNTYYEVAGEVGVLAITLPTPTDLTKVSMVVLHLTAGTTPNVVIGSTAVIDYSAAYDISASKEYEINCLFNGGKWVVADMEVV